MADSISRVSKISEIMSKMCSTYSFSCHCTETSQNHDFDTFSAPPFEARGKKKQARPQERFTCQARQRLLRRLQLIFLSTLLILTQPRRLRRLYLTNLQKCLKDKRFCANQALGRLFRTPLKSWFSTSVLRGLPTNPGQTQSCTGSGSRIFRRRTMDSTITALRLVQKTSGLFDTAEAGDRTVAGEVSEPGFKVGKMEPVSPEQGESLGGIFQDMMPMDDLTPGVDYLDSFMDLSNFLNMDMEEKAPEKDPLVEAFGQEMTGELDFSGILTSLKEEADAFTIPSCQVDTSSESEGITSLVPDRPLKRKLAEPEVVEGPMIGNVITIEMMETEQVPDSSTSDHDYVVKKPRLVSTSYEIESPTPVTSSTITSTATPPTKYRERRDKNNAASRRSRQIRKDKYVKMEVEAEELAVKNDELRAKIVELEKLAKFMKAELINQMTKK